jgi:hypothetical protein
MTPGPWARRAGLGLAVVVLACVDRTPRPVEEPPAEGVILPEPDAVPPAAVPIVRTPPGLAAVQALPVEGRTGPGGRPFEVTARTAGAVSYLHRPMGAETFGIALRGAGLVHYPCSSCHTPGMRVPRPPATAPATHRDIQPVHPAGTGAACATCHAVSRVDRLVLQSGDTATLDQAYRLCAQCHFAQVDAWAAGGHGKRLESWRDRRIVMNCTDCHDPHRPALGRRIPFPGPTLPRTGGAGR